MEESFFFDTLAISDLRGQESWETLLSKVPLLPRGWFELAGLGDKERIELYCEFWISRLGISSAEASSVLQFFSSLEALEVFAYKISPSGPFQPCLVYLRKEGVRSFVGYPPVQQSSQIPSFCGDSIYRNFFCIHDGFGDFEDKGLLSSKDVARACQKLRNLLVEEGVCDPSEDCYTLGVFPFYESFSPGSYRCFLVNPEVCRRYPSPNIAFSSENIEIAGDIILGEKPFSVGKMSYPSFFSWFEQYLLGEVLYDNNGQTDR